MLHDLLGSFLLRDSPKGMNGSVEVRTVLYVYVIRFVLKLNRSQLSVCPFCINTELYLYSKLLFSCCFFSLANLITVHSMSQP